MVKGWIDRLGTVWVEGQIAQMNVRPNSSTAYITLRDPAATHDRLLRTIAAVDVARTANPTDDGVRGADEHDVDDAKGAPPLADAVSAARE